MKTMLLSVLLCAWAASAGAQGLAVHDDFSACPDGPPPDAWDLAAGQWSVLHQRLVAASDAGFCHTRRVPELDAFDYTARLAVDKNTASNDWSTAGITVFLDAQNHWRLNLVAGPDGRRYTEFGETFRGTWQAQSADPTTLRKSTTEFQQGEWRYATDYLLRIKLSATDIYGEIVEADSHRTIARYRYFWDAAEGVKFGRPGLSAHGLGLACASVTVTAEPPAASAALPVENGKAGRVALVKDLSGAEPALVATLAAAFRQAGFGVTLLTGAELAAPASFSVLRFDYVVLLGTRFFPSPAHDNFLRFLRSGGHAVVLGGDVFAEPVALLNGRWCSAAEVERALAAIAPETTWPELTKPSARTWSRNSDMAQFPSTLVAEARGVRCDIKGLHGWDKFAANIPAFPAGQTLLCFQAKGDAATPQVMVEIDEQDGSRWIATLDITPDWQPYVLTPERFAPWEAKALKKKMFNPRNAAKLSFGLAANFTTRAAKGDHTFWVDALGTASNRVGRLDLAQRVDLNIFSDYEPYRLTDVVAVGPAPGNNVTAPVPPVPGACGGLAAIGYAFPNESKFIPLLSTFDAHGRDRGWAAGMLVNYSGAYRGSTWIISGITNGAFYAAPAVLRTLTDAMQAARGPLATQARLENARAKAVEIKLATPAPPGFIRLSPDGRHLVAPDGRRFFMSGCNYVGPFELCGGRMWRDDYFSAAVVTEDFRKARAAGLNCMRYWVSGIDKEIARGDFRKVDVIKECARKYGIYLLLDLPGTGYPTVAEMCASHQALARAFRDEPMVLGYDLRNEPYVGTIAGIKYPDGQQPPILTRNLQPQHRAVLSDKLLREMATERPDWLKLSRSVRGAEAENAIAAIYLWGQYVKRHDIGSSTTPGIVDRLPEDAEYRDVVEVVDQSFALWIRLQIEAVRSVDTNHLITVGHHQTFSCLPANRPLDFISQHVYARPNSLADVLENVTTLDRLAVLWPGKPITFGEFGYSTGIPMPQGYLDRYTASVGELMHYLYAFSKNYDGVKKWMLNDWPYKIMTHYGDWNKGAITRTYEERFGMYYYDGTPAGRPKPIVPALRFFGDYIAGLAPSGQLDIVPGPLSIGAAYVYRNTNALFIGNTQYNSPRLAFTADRPANVMLSWDAQGLRLMSSADAHVRLQPAAFGPYGMTVTGRHGTLQTDGPTLTLDLLEGETLLIK